MLIFLSNSSFFLRTCDILCIYNGRKYEIKITKTNSDTNYYVIKDIKTPSGKRTTMIYEKLGNEQDLLIK